MTCELILKADYILPIITPPIKDGAIHIKDGVIVKCDNFSKISVADKRVIELKNACLLPGLVNGHTHLELTSLKGKIPYQDSFIQWIRHIIEAKKNWDETDYIDSLKLGVKELIVSGTTTVADITISGLSPQILFTSGLRCRIYKEITGFKSNMISSIIAGIKEYLSNLQPTNLVNFGLAPHAPYSVNPKLFIELTNLAKINNLPLSIHIAEAKEEIEFLTKGTGDGIELLKELNVWDNNWKPSGLTPVKYLHSLKVLDSNVIGVHLNYINDEEIEILKEKRVGIVHCPKSHNFFQHENFPIQKLIDKGIILALGTDSLASNNSLSLLEEMKELKKRYKSLSSETILQLATINGAKILKLDDKIGTLQSGKKADIIGLKLPNNLTEDRLYDFIVEDVEDVVIEMVEGNFLTL